jgi:hypothetical protein
MIYPVCRLPAQLNLPTGRYKNGPGMSGAVPVCHLAVTAAVEAATVETAAVPSASASVGEIWLAEDSRAQYRSRNTRYSL